MIKSDNNDGLDKFLHVYQSTMKRRNGYEFSAQYFKNLCERLNNQIMFFYSVHKNSVISVELVLIGSENVYSFLGGTLADKFHLRPNDLLKYEIIRWARGIGKKRFILGGGNYENDGIFQYKIAFSPKGAVPKYEGKRILNQQYYDQLVENNLKWHGINDRKWIPNRSFFPRYRG